MRLAADNILNTHAPHQPGHRASREIEALSAKLAPHLTDAVDPSVPFKYATDLGAQRLITAGTV